MERGDIGTRRPDGSVYVQRDQPEVCFLYGPFWRLAQGAYRLSVRCRIGAPKVRPAVVLGVEIIAESRAQVAWRDFTAAELAAGSLDLEFIVSPKLSRDAGGSAIFEFRLFHFGNADITVSAVLLRRLEVATDGVSARRWRLSGRSDPRRAKPADADGFVEVKRWAPSGQFLHRVGSMAGLPAGRYRLRFHCRAAAPRNARRPVLSVEIVNLYVSHQADFYADELAGGAGSIDFEVPPELGMEGGAAAPVAVKFSYLRNGRLAIGAIELALSDAANSPTPPALAARDCCFKFPLKKIGKNSQKDLIIVGNCHASLIYEGFRGVPELQRYFRARYYNVNLQEQFYDEARRDLENCEFLV